MALEELHNTLAIYTLYRERTSNILALLRYVYANMNEFARGGKNLRMLLRDYLRYKISISMKNDEFKVLIIEDKRSLLGDFIKMITKRIN